jgi:hypothetical protein
MKSIKKYLQNGSIIEANSQVLNDSPVVMYSKHKDNPEAESVEDIFYDVIEEDNKILPTKQIHEASPVKVNSSVNKESFSFSPKEKVIYEFMYRL